AENPLERQFIDREPRTRLPSFALTMGTILLPVGRDAGKLVVGTSSAVLEGQVISDVFQVDRQTQAPNFNLDGYQQSQKAMALCLFGCFSA
ncbi:hypothetical protein Q6332_28740, partial [Klebsiella pneumoniae]|uniref:hypothetical protein n=1 Tax=Klebsiella pneumoniae TaxID=573 RepID=UPI0027307363